MKIEIKEEYYWYIHDCILVYGLNQNTSTLYKKRQHIVWLVIWRESSFYYFIVSLTNLLVFDIDRTLFLIIRTTTSNKISPFQTPVPTHSNTTFWQTMASGHPPVVDPSLSLVVIITLSRGGTSFTRPTDRPPSGFTESVPGRAGVEQTTLSGWMVGYRQNCHVILIYGFCISMWTPVLSNTHLIFTHRKTILSIILHL